MNRMLHDRLNPDHDAEARYMRIRTYALCIFGELIWIAFCMLLGAAGYSWLYQST